MHYVMHWIHFIPVEMVVSNKPLCSKRLKWTCAVYFWLLVHDSWSWMGGGGGKALLNLWWSHLVNSFWTPKIQSASSRCISYPNSLSNIMVSVLIVKCFQSSFANLLPLIEVLTDCSPTNTGVMMPIPIFESLENVMIYIIQYYFSINTKN